jgi:anthranilate synthase component 1
VEQVNAMMARLREPPPPMPASAPSSGPLNSNMSRDDFLKMVEKAKRYIFAGDIIQVVLSQRFSASSSVPPIQLYRALRLLNPSPYTFFLKMGGQVLVGSSPEVMVRLSGSRMELRPIAGTRPRGATEQEDRRLADELLACEKEKAEHVMLVDLGRNDLGRLAEAGSVQVTEYMVIERYSHVMHIVSHVEGLARKGVDAYDVIRATFPAGTLSGAPKVRAMEIINELEPGPRGVYGGAVGYIGYDGNMDLAIPSARWRSVVERFLSRPGLALFTIPTLPWSMKRLATRRAPFRRPWNWLPVDLILERSGYDRSGGQLRFVHLQPRPDDGGAGGRHASLSQRRHND